MTLSQWGKRKAELKAARKAAYLAGDLDEWHRIDAETDAHNALRAAIEAETQRIKSANRARDAAIKKGQNPKPKRSKAAPTVAPVVPAPAPVVDWYEVEARERELAALERLMTHRTGVNVGAP